MTQDNMMAATSTTEKVIQWGRDKGIVTRGNAPGQFLKMIEEVGEVAECIAKDKDSDSLELEIGDLMVTIILLSDISGINTETALDRAYAKISKRTGRTTPDGVFIKDGD
jgi:uncharacterized protein YabN with tetrapyrrole methylase and pyrophosphatase domain